MEVQLRIQSETILGIGNKPVNCLNDHAVPWSGGGPNDMTFTRGSGCLGKGEELRASQHMSKKKNIMSMIIILSYALHAATSWQKSICLAHETLKSRRYDQNQVSHLRS